MRTLSIALFGTVGFYILSVIFAFFYNKNNDELSQRELMSIQEEFQETSYKFNNPDLAYQVLTQLEVITDSDIALGYQPKSRGPKPYLNLKTDDQYCDMRRAYFVEYPESLFEEMDFLTDRIPKSIVRNKVLNQVGHDIQPNIGLHIASNDPNLYDIKPTVTNFFTKMIMYPEKRIGQHFSCLSQISNQLIGKQPIAIKDTFTETVAKYAERFQGRQHCFDVDTFFPKTYPLYQKDQCRDFFDIFNSPEYLALKEQQKVVYIRKIGRGSHMGAGVELVTDSEEAELRELYADGHNCGKIEDNYLLQKYIANPLLINGHKFDFNLFMLVASVNPLIAYYHDGYLKVSITDYDLDSHDKKSFLSNIKVNQKNFNADDDTDLHEAMSEEELNHAQQWTFERFAAYLLETGVVKDSNWLDNYLRPQFKKAMIHLMRFGLVSPTLNSGIYQLYGVDFMMDADLNLWFLEANSSPALDGFSQAVEKMAVKMVKDELEIAMGLLRSRMKRVISFVNELVDSSSVKEDEEGEVVIKNIEIAKVKFSKINENYFEREFEPSVENGFKKIVDENLKGASKYMGFITQECL